MTRVLAVCLALGTLALGGCAGRELVLELHTAVMYDKPRIDAITYEVSDARAEGGDVVLRVTVAGDAGLQATFDVSPGVVDHEPMQEARDGNYEGLYRFPAGLVGGPYTVVGRLMHEKAGEVIRSAADPLIISLYR